MSTAPEEPNTPENCASRAVARLSDAASELRDDSRIAAGHRYRRESSVPLLRVRVSTSLPAAPCSMPSNAAPANAATAEPLPLASATTSAAAPTFTAVPPMATAARSC